MCRAGEVISEVIWVLIVGERHTWVWRCSRRARDSSRVLVVSVMIADDARYC